MRSFELQWLRSTVSAKAFVRASNGAASEIDNQPALGLIYYAAPKISEAEAHYR